MQLSWDNPSNQTSIGAVFLKRKKKIYKRLSFWCGWTKPVRQGQFQVGTTQRLLFSITVQEHFLCFCYFCLEVCWWNSLTEISWIKSRGLHWSLPAASFHQPDCPGWDRWEIQDGRRSDPAQTSGCRWADGTTAGKTTGSVVPTSLQRPVSTTTSRIKLLNSAGGPSSEPTESRTSRSGLCVYITDAWSQSKLMDSVYLMSNRIMTWLERKMNYVFIYLRINICIFVLYLCSMKKLTLPFQHAYLWCTTTEKITLNLEVRKHPFMDERRV